MTTEAALTLARTVKRGNDARLQLHRDVLGDSRKRKVLAKAILAGTTDANRDLYAFHYGTDYDDARAWELLLDMVAK